MWHPFHSRAWQYMISEELLLLGLYPFSDSSTHPEQTQFYPSKWWVDKSLQAIACVHVSLISHAGCTFSDAKAITDGVVADPEDLKERLHNWNTLLQNIKTYYQVSWSQPFALVAQRNCQLWGQGWRELVRGFQGMIDCKAWPICKCMIVFSPDKMSL